jgi:hypothetical protein
MNLISSRRARPMSARGLAKGLGWFSIGLGVAELFAPRWMARVTGLEGRERLVQAYGAREIATGVGILGSDNPAPWVWGRVGGDALDLATLGTGAGTSGRRLNATLALAAVAGVTMLDFAVARAVQRRNRHQQFDYSDRSGFNRPVEEMRGVARRDFQPPRDMTTPEALRPQQTEAVSEAGQPQM